jgi:ATP dependent DNA ligase domain
MLPAPPMTLGKRVLGAPPERSESSSAMKENGRRQEWLRPSLSGQSTGAWGDWQLAGLSIQCAPPHPVPLSIRVRPVRPVMYKRRMLWRSSSPVRHPPGFIEPCLPTLGHALPAGPQWAHEIKHDGYRFICRVEGNRIRVFSRRGNDYTDRVPRIVDTLLRLPASSVTLDGEGVACDPNGVTNFELLRAALGRPAKREAFLSMPSTS